MTTVQIEISDQKAAALKAKATMRGVSAEQYVRQMVDRDLEEALRSRRLPIVIFRK